MIKHTPIYISTKGGSIICFNRGSIRVFQSCSGTLCKFSNDLRSAKEQLDFLESNFFLSPARAFDIPLHRKTTLKWKANGELSEVDKARILSLLDPSELTECELTCDVA